MLRDWLLKKLQASAKPDVKATKPKRRVDAMQRNLYAGMLAALAVVCTSAALLVLVRDPLLHSQQVSVYSAAATSQHAAYLEHYVKGLQRRLEATSQLEEVHIALLDGQDETITAVSAALIVDYPEAFDLRVIRLGAPGDAVLKEDAGLRYYIEADLLSRVSDGDVHPESYPHEDTWLTSMAAQVNTYHENVHGAILLTIDNRQLHKMLFPAVGDTGKVIITQPFRSGNNMRSREILQTPGDGRAESAQTATIDGTNWTLSFAPSEKSILSLRPDPIAPIAGSLGLALALLTILFLIHRQNTKCLAHDIEKLCYGHTRKEDAWQALTILGPVAKRMERLRKDETDTATSEDLGNHADDEPEKSQPTPNDDKEFFTDPLFQNHDLVDEDQTTKDLANVSAIGAPEGNIPETIFRSNDIRGHAEEQLRDDVVYCIARSIATLCLDAGDKHVIVGADGRHSSPRIKTALINGLLESGCDVIDIGAVTTPLVSFATHTLGPPNGVMVTGSHCPGHINGLKITVASEVVCGQKMAALHELCLRGGFIDAQGSLSTIDLVPTYRDRICSDIDIGVPQTIVVDAGHSVGGSIAPSIFEKLGCAVIPVNCLVDPDFPKHDPDPGVDQNLEQLRTTVLQNRADLGIALDGDADRLVVVTGSGELVRPDRLLMILARDVLERQPGSAIVYDIKSSHHLATVIGDAGGIPTLSRTGHGFMRERLQESNAMLGAEFSGHIFYKERWFGFDDGIYAAARLLEILSNCDGDLDSLLADLPESQSTPEILVPVADTAKENIITRLVEQARFEGAKLNTLDGLRADYPDGWGLIRASNTSAALTLRFEAADDMALIRIRKVFKDQITQVVPEIANDL